jgi:hypothetical protein
MNCDQLEDPDMQEIRQELQTFLSGSRKPQPREGTVKQVRKNRGVRVSTYRELVEKVAELAFANPEFVLLFRGQTRDFPERGLTTLFPSMFRFGSDPKMYGFQLRERYEVLQRKEKALINRFRRQYNKRFSRNSLLRWTILQHYEICPTPLLDVTQSLHVAASFAFVGAPEDDGESFLYVLALPQISGSVTVVSDQSLQILRLSSVCPPTTLRPYFQEGYLIGTFPVLDSINEKMEYRRSEVDCANRLIAKFRLRRNGFWGSGFNPLTDEALYPDENHPFNRRIGELRDPR